MDEPNDFNMLYIGVVVVQVSSKDFVLVLAMTIAEVAFVVLALSEHNKRTIVVENHITSDISVYYVDAIGLMIVTGYNLVKRVVVLVYVLFM